MLPLLLGAGRMLAAGAARGAASGAATGGVRKAIVGGVKDSLKKGVVEGAKDKAKSFLKKKSSAIKKVSPQKLLPRSKKGGGGGGLVRRKSSAIVRRKTSSIVKLTPEKLTPEEQKTQKKEQQKPFDGDELIKELTAIKETLIKIKGVLGTNLKNTLKDQKNQRILRSKEKASQRESELEKKPAPKEGGIKLGLPKKAPSLFDMIWRFISNVLMGSLLNFLFNYVPQIIKMFEEIGKGLENPLQQLRLGIITLTTLFPKQIKFLAKLTSKIIGPPARLIGKLLLKAGNIAGNLFKKAGGIIVNLIKGPLTSLVKKVGGEALEKGVKSAAKGAANLAGRAASGAGRAAGTAGRILTRLGLFRKILSKPPIIGALIGFIIDLIMGEKPARAAAGAAGAAIGAGIGGFLGTIGSGALTASTLGIGALAAPFIIGASGFIGSAAGDWLGKAIYDKVSGGVNQVNKQTQVQGRASGGMLGSIKSFFGFGGSKKSTSVSSAVRKPSLKTREVSVEVEAKAKDEVLKDKKSLERFKTLSSIFGGTPFVGQLLKMGIDIGMGAKIDKTETDLAAQDIGYTIGKAMEDGEFSIPGLNKRIIGPLTKNLTEWAKKKIFYEVKNREGSFPSIEKDGEDKQQQNAAGSKGDEDGGGEPGPVVTGGNSDFWTLVAIASLESGTPQGRADVAQSIYNRLASGVYTGKTIKELILAQNQYQPVRESDTSLWRSISDKQSAIAAVGSHSNGRGRSSKMIEETAAAIQNSTLQQSAAQFVGGRTDFWAEGLTPPASGIGYVVRHGHRFGWFVGPGAIAYGRKNPGPARAPRLGDITVAARPAGSGGGPSGRDGESNVSSLQAGKKGKIYLHWNAAANDNSFGYQTRYHSIFTADGKKHQKTPYTQFRTPEGHTAYRNSLGVGLAVAAMKDYNWAYKPKQRQLDAMAQEAANLAKAWGWNAGMVNVRNVATHAEVGSMKDGVQNPGGDNYGPTYWGGDGARTDMHKLSPTDPDGSGGDKVRAMIKQKMGGMGGGNGFNHHALPPLAMGGHTVTSSMGLRNFALSPGMHMGVDIAGRTGEPLQAFTDGVVEATGRDGGYGNYISWVDDKGIGHFYAHMNKPAFVRRGTKVKKGTILGELGSTGRSSGPHLHWEAATNPRDTGMSKASVLTRFNPLSKYNKESPFGGSIRPDASAAEAETGTPMQPSAPGSPASTPSSEPSQFSDPKYFADAFKGDPASKEYIASLSTPSAPTVPTATTKSGPKGGGSGISVTSNGGGNKPLKPGTTYGFGNLNPHHSDEGVTRSYGPHKIGVPKDYGMGILPQYMPSGPNGRVPLPVSGKVLMKEWHRKSGYGRTVVVDTSLGKMQFSHLSAFGNFKEGDQLSAGTVIGTQGGSGNSGEKDYAEHLHINAPKSGHEAFVNFITSGKPTTGSVSQSSEDSSGSGSGSNTSGGTSTQPEPEQSQFSDPKYFVDAFKGDAASQAYIDSLPLDPVGVSTVGVSTSLKPTSPPKAPVLPPPTPAVIAPKGTSTVSQQAQKISSKASYDQGGQPNILMMPLPPQQSSSPQQSGGGKSQSPLDSDMLNNDVHSVSTSAVNLFLTSALYKR